jgi:hypothetical protein
MAESRLEHLKSLAAGYAALKNQADGVADLTETLRWAVEQIEPTDPEHQAARERCRREVEQGRMDEIDEWVLEYVRGHSTDPFAREMANRAADRRDED